MSGSDESIMQRFSTRTILVAVLLVALVPGAIRAAPPVSAHLKEPDALTGGLRFRSKGTVQALVFTIDHHLAIQLEPVDHEQKRGAMRATVTDVAHGMRIRRGLLERALDGSLRAPGPELVNIPNIISLESLLPKLLSASPRPVVVDGEVEIQGDVRAVTFTHHHLRTATDGSLIVRTSTASADGKVSLVTLWTLAADGLPRSAQTSGTVKCGPVTARVAIRLDREG